MQHPDVLTEPEPEVFFKGFGDSSLDFELQFWVMQESNAVKINSEVALAAMRLLDDAGIEIPFPQRDLRLRSVDPAAAELLSPDGPRSDEESEPEEHRESRAVGEWRFTTLFATRGFLPLSNTHRSCDDPCRRDSDHARV